MQTAARKVRCKVSFCDRRPVRDESVQIVQWNPGSMVEDRRIQRVASAPDSQQTMRKLGDNAATKFALNHPLEKLLQPAQLQILHNRRDPLSIEIRSLKIFFETVDLRQAPKLDTAS